MSEPGQCTNCRADILVGGLCLRCAEALQRQNGAMREALEEADGALSKFADITTENRAGWARQKIQAAITPTAGSDLVTREEHEAEVKQLSEQLLANSRAFTALMQERAKLRAQLTEAQQQLKDAIDVQKTDHADKLELSGLLGVGEIQAERVRAILALIQNQKPTKSPNQKKVKKYVTGSNDGSNR